MTARFICKRREKPLILTGRTMAGCALAGLILTDRILAGRTRTGLILTDRIQAGHTRTGLILTGFIQAGRTPGIRILARARTHMAGFSR